ncbi:Mov34/MPN/PAD-1 family protein [Variovorax sp. HW608]|jgi:integrative and conjugative element protein (TIGR02256 family)|uniref:Mov34/MPN/PAD-1 family protein n=1 Tax=Variovorax sp. HW608 TaxID=1034889 RepID=UPI000B5AD4CC|nr:Mov34/MPN/PAD-1 family protein [Variovorax sp. HW608]
MVISRLGRKLQPTGDVTATCPATDQRIILQVPVVAYVQRHRQISSDASEAGGQLFGTLSAEALIIQAASGPYTGDERSRYRYRSNPRAAQEAIEQHARLGRLYLGEWHTHAEDRPSASSLDVDAMKRLIANSGLNSSALLMLIVGRRKGAEGLALWTATRGGETQWTISS